MKRWVLFCLIVFVSKKNFADEMLPSPAEYLAAAQKLKTFYLLSTTHDSLTSAVPISYHFTKKVGAHPTDYGVEFSFSVMNAQISSSTAEAFDIFGYDTSDLPEALNMYRFHFSKPLSISSDLSLSLLVNPTQEIYGGGMTLKHNFLRLGAFYTSYDLHFSYGLSPGFMRSYLGGLTLLQSIKIQKLDLFAGLDLNYGAVKFDSADGEYSFDYLIYDSFKNAGNNFHFGIKIPMPFENTYVTFSRYFGDQESWFLKFSYQSPTFMDFREKTKWDR